MHPLMVKNGKKSFISMRSGLKWYEIDALSTRSFARSLAPLARSLAPLARSLAPHCSLRSCAPLRSFARSALLASLTHSGAHGKAVLSMKWTRRFHTVSTHCATAGQILTNTIREASWITKSPFQIFHVLYKFIRVWPCPCPLLSHITLIFTDFPI